MPRRPTIFEDSKLLVPNYDGGRLEPWNIVAFGFLNEKLVHRVADVDRDEAVTMGDDSEVPERFNRGQVGGSSSSCMPNPVP